MNVISPLSNDCNPVVFGEMELKMIVRAIFKKLSSLRVVAMEYQVQYKSFTVLVAFCNRFLVAQRS